MEQDIYKNLMNKEREAIPVSYLSDVLHSVLQNPQKSFVIAMRGPQGSGKDTTAFSLAEKAGWEQDQIISTDEFSYLNSDELAVIFPLLEKTGTRENAINQNENLDRLTEEEKEQLYSNRKNLFPELVERMKDSEKYHWTEEKRDWAQLYLRLLAGVYLKNGKSVIANVMHAYAYSLKPILALSDANDAEFMTLFPDQQQERTRNGKKTVVSIHDGHQWFPEQFDGDNLHKVSPEKVKKFADEFEWSLTRDVIEKAVKPTPKI